MTNLDESVFITGASGFLGSALVRYLEEKNIRTLKLCRHTGGADIVSVKDISDVAPEHLVNCSVVVHCAARAHVMSDSSINPLSEFRKVNVDGTLNLAKAAIEAGVKRFIFISSIKAAGELTYEGHSLSPSDTPMPDDAYGISKLEAEIALKKISKSSGMDVVIIRPPLVYGPGMKGNLSSLLKLIQSGFPLPLGGIRNKRSLISIDNLVNAIYLSILEPAVGGEILHVSDDDDLSTTQLVELLANSCGTQVRLFPVPKIFFRLFLKLLRKDAVYDRIFSSLQVDVSKTKRVLNWNPLISVEEGFKRCCK